MPVKIKDEIKPVDFGKSLLFFPVVGSLIGILLSATAWAFGFLPNMVMSIIILIVSFVITGGIHMDGFADTCDGFYGGRTKERILEIMKDSRIGTMGAIGIVLLLLLKFSIIANFSKEVLWKVLILAPVFGRWSQTIACYTCDYARQEGKGKYFVEYADKKAIIIGALFTLMLSLVLFKVEGFFLFIIPFFAICLLIWWIKRRIGGMTGDTIGAVSEVAEAVVFLSGLIMYRN